MPQALDQILMNNLVFHGYVGVHEAEKKEGQPFEIDLVLGVRHLKAVETDRLEDTIDYGAVYRDIRQLMATARFDLIERLAGAIADLLLEGHPLLDTVWVTVRKPQAPIDGSFAYMGVHLQRRRS